MQLPSAREEACSLIPHTLAKLLLSSRCWGFLWSHPLALCPSEGGRREGDALPISCLPFCPSSSSPSAWDPKPFLPPMLLLQGPGLGPDSLSCARTPVLWGCSWLPSLPRMDMAVGFQGLAGWCQLLVLRPARGPGQDPPPLTRAQADSLAMRVSPVCLKGWIQRLPSHPRVLRLMPAPGLEGKATHLSVPSYISIPQSCQTPTGAFQCH